MGLRINQNIAAMNAYRNLSVTDGQMSKQLEKLSSGFRINRAADDAAGLAISEGLRSQVGGLKVAVRNSQDGISVVQTAEGALSESHSILQRMRDLAVQSSNDTNDATSRSAIHEESEALKLELTRIADKTTFNNINLLDGSFNTKAIQVGYGAGDTINVDIESVGATAAKTTYALGIASTIAATATFTAGGVVVTTGVLAVQAATAGTSVAATNIAAQLNNDTNFKSAFTAKVNSAGELEVALKDSAVVAAGGVVVSGTGLAGANTVAANAASGNKGFSTADLNLTSVDLTTKVGSQAAITSLDTAITAVSTSRAKLGALQNRFEHTINSLNVASENLTASESRIRDTDMAQEMVSFTRAQILSQAGTSMLAQANQAPQSVLSLLR